MGITQQQAQDYLASPDLLGLGLEADAVRQSLHPENVVTYVRQVRLVLTASTSPQQLHQAALEATAAGASSLSLDATGLSLTALLTHFAALGSSFPSLSLHGLGPSLIHAFARSEALPARDILGRLQQAGLRSLADEETPSIDHASNLAIQLAIDLAIHRAAHALGLPTTAVLLFGNGETTEQLTQRLEDLRQLQSETNGLLALRPIPHRAPPDAPYAHSEEPTAIELLKTLAVCRLMADNIAHIETSWSTTGPKVLQMALRFGADDAGSALHGTDHEEELRRIIREAGFRPAERESTYASLALY